MKKITMMILAGACALAGVLSSCNRTLPEAENPNYDKNTNSVTTQFAFNIATNMTPTTRMTVANTQGDNENFRGIQDTKLQTFKLGTDGVYVPGTATSADKEFDLGVVLGVGEASTSPAVSKRVLELSLPLGTNTLLFYGRAKKASGADKNDIGDVTYTVSSSPASTSFSLTSRLGANSADLTKAENMIAAVMTYIIQSSTEYAFYWPINSASDIVDVTNVDIDGLPASGTQNPDGHAGQTIYKGTVNWYDYGEDYAANLAAIDGGTPAPNDLKPLEETLGETFNSIASISDTEVRAGSGSSVERTIKDLATVINRVRNATATSYQEQIAVQLAKRIYSILGNFFENLGSNTAFLSMSDIAAHYNTLTGNTLSVPTIISNLGQFPTAYDLPMGAAQLKYTEDTRTFSYASSTLNFGFGSATDVSRIMYPAEILYFGNSPIRTSNTPHVPADYPEGVANWNGAWSADWTDNQHVLSTTRSVAMIDNIQYGTALLKSTVRYGAASLNDNTSGKFTGESDKTINVASSANVFSLTGILIGGQHNQMGWNYLAKANDFSYVIYDKSIASNAIPQYTGTVNSDKSSPNYTLVFDNYDSSIADNSPQNDVYVALEFQNINGGDFWGRDNLVRSGGTFYIVGKLDPAAPGLSAITFPTGYPIPPYNISGSTVTTKEITRVFIQDFMTEANFVIGANSLKAAYVTVPDLRSSQITLGLSVDIRWETGLVFNDVVLGAN